MAASGMARTPAPPHTIQKKINSKTKYNVSRISFFWPHNPTITPPPTSYSLKDGIAAPGMVQPPPPSKSNKFYKLTVIKLQAPTFISIGMYYPSFISEKNHPATPLRDGSMPPPMTQNNGSGKIEMIQLLTCNFICIVMYYPPLIPEIISLLPPSGVALRRMAEKKKYSYRLVILYVQSCTTLLQFMKKSTPFHHQGRLQRGVTTRK